MTGCLYMSLLYKMDLEVVQISLAFCRGQIGVFCISLFLKVCHFVGPSPANHYKNDISKVGLGPSFCST